MWALANILRGEASTIRSIGFSTGTLIIEIILIINQRFGYNFDPDPDSRIRIKISYSDLSFGCARKRVCRDIQNLTDYIIIIHL